MKHRIYSFPPRAEEKQIHTQFTEEVPLRAQPDRRQGPSWGWGWGGSSRSHNSHTVAYRGEQTSADAGGGANLLCLGWVGRPCWLTQVPGLGWVAGRVWEPHFSRSLSNLGFTKEKPANAVWSMESMRFLSL